MSAAKIMIVEDNTTVAKDCQECLENFGYKVTSIVVSGEESIRKAETELPDAVLMDIHLRDKMDGIEVAEQIYTRFEIPVVFLSAYGDRELLEKAKKVGSFGYLIKPFEERELHATLEMALYKAKTTKQNKQMEAKLRLLQKMEAIATLTGGIAHDYNNLLSIIVGNLGLAQQDAETGSDQAGFLHEAEKAARKVGDLTHELMALSRGGGPIKELGSIRESLKQATHEVPAESGIVIEESVADDLWLVPHDARKMGSVFRNVMRNALEAMPDGGSLTLDAQNLRVEDGDALPGLSVRPGDYVGISIQDNGIGISEENLDKIFDPYFSTKAMGTQKGMGLGLATAHAIVKKHGGDITIQSTRDVGTTVHIYLPASADAQAQQARQAGLPATGSESEKPSTARNDETGPQSPIQRVLLMDDEEMLRNLAPEMLGRLGYEVKTVKDGVEAIEVYKKELNSGKPFDAVVLDLTIKGGMGGEQTLRELLKVDPQVKAIVASGYFNDPVMENFQDYGFKGAMAKPYKMKDLKGVLEEVLQP